MFLFIHYLFGTRPVAEEYSSQALRVSLGFGFWKALL